MFKRLKQQKLYQDQWHVMYQDDIEFPDGERGKYTWVNRKNGVSIVVLTPDDKILLSKEYRYVIDDFSWEIPGGGIDSGETPEEAAIRELEEETGLQVTQLEKLGMFYPLSSFNTESITVFYTTIQPKSVTTEKTESGEEIGEQRYISFAKALEMIDTGEITDALTAAAVQMIIRKKENKV